MTTFTQFHDLKSQAVTAYRLKDYVKAKKLFVDAAECMFHLSSEVSAELGHEEIIRELIDFAKECDSRIPLKSTGTSRLKRKKTKVLKLANMIGLSREKQKSHVLIRACQTSGDTFPHTLLHGIGGTGKTALARAIAYELDYHFFETHAAPFKKPELLYETLTKASKQAQRAGKPLLFFVDEIHRLRLLLQEALYSPMKEWWIPTLDGKQALPPFTLFGATTRLDMLDANSFVTRFENSWEIRRYEVIDLAIIVAQEFKRFGLRFDPDVTHRVAERCLGVPRTAVNLASKIRNMALADSSDTVTSAHVRDTFTLEEIDEMGLNPIHHRYLQILDASQADGKHAPIGIGAISANMRQPEEGVKGSVEPVLLELGFVSPTPRGRMLTTAGSEYLKKL